MRLFPTASLSRFASLSLFAGLGAAILAVSGCQSNETQASAAAPQPAEAPQTGRAAPNYPGLTGDSLGGQPNLTFNGRPAVEAADAPSITAKAAILVDSRGRVLYEKNADTRLPTASTQKLLLGIMIAERGGLSQPLTVQDSDTWAEPTKMGIKAGQTYTREELLLAVLVRSSNDIARALARDHSGSVSSFAANMNVKARQLGMYNSYFTNASGLPTPSGQYSTARDLSILGRAALRNGFVRNAIRTKGLYFRFADGSTKAITNTNQVLKHFPYCTGAKTGYTHAAGRCLVSSASYGGREVIAVILGSKTPNVWTESEALLKYGLGM